MLELYRRHLKTCPHVSRGQSYSLCHCPIWVYGLLNGERIRQSMQTHDAVTANQRLAKMGTEAPAAKSPTVAAAAESFIASCRQRGLARRTIVKYNQILGHLCDCMKSYMIEQIDAAAIDRLAVHRKVDFNCVKDHQPRPGMVRPSTWRTNLIGLQAFFEFAIQNKWATENPVKNIALPKVRRLVTPPFMPSESGALMRAAEVFTFAERMAAKTIDEKRRQATALVHVLLYTGLRIGDVAALERDALNLKTQYLTLRTEKTGVPIRVKLKPETITALQRLPIRNPKYFFWDGRILHDAAVVHLQRLLGKVGKEAGVENVHAHRFRDTFAVELLSQGVDIRVVQKLLGHSSVRTTEEHYAHFIHRHQELLDAATARLDFDQSSSGSAAPFLVQAKRN